MSIVAPRPLHAFDNDSIRPGPVGSVGDVFGTVKLKHSMPDLPIRKITLSDTVGANVQDGDKDSYTSHGHQARVVDSNWQSGRQFKTSHGWVIEDLRAEDRLHEPFMGEGPQYSWKNKIATTYEARRTGNLFLPLPGGYNPSPGEIERGQVVPEVTNIEGGDVLAGDIKFKSQPRAILGSRNTQSGFIRPVAGRR